MSDSIRVVCRLRPLNKIELANKGEECVTYSQKELTITVDQSKHNFAFDRIFGPSTAQVEVYKEVAVPVVRAVMGGFNGTIFAYGQTGGGKTWTMEGPNHHDAQFRGLIPRTIQGLFQGICQGDANVQFVVKCSYIQIYNEKLFDLLDPSKSRLQIKEDKHRGVFIQNCTEVSVGSSEQMLKHMDAGANNRKVAFTGMNQRSSRSHSLFIIHLSQKHLKKDSTKQSKLYFVDLAGSEKVSKTGCQGQQLEQAKNINKSLSSLGNVINALTSDKKEHIPYRDSKLTRILQQSLGGNSKTTLIINCSMCSYNDRETLSTLRFGYRAKSIKNKAKVNEEKSAKQLLILLDAANRTIAQLTAQLTGKEPLKIDEMEGTEKEERSAQVQELREQLEAMRAQQEERERQLREMELRVKNLFLELSESKEAAGRHQESCGRLMRTLKGSLGRLNKYMSRVYIDLEYWLNNLIVDGTQQSEEINSNLTLTFQNIMEFTSFYEKELRPLLTDQEDRDREERERQEQEREEARQRSRDRCHSKKIKLIYSEPTLRTGPAEELQMSCFVNQQEDQITVVNSSDKVSQEESLSEIETLLESLETKESQRMLVEEMSSNLKALRKDNEELQTRYDLLLAQNQAAIEQVDLKYQEKLIDLQERVQEYRNIIKEKDIEITSYIKELEKERSATTNEKVLSERLRKVIQSSQNLKSHYEMEQRLRSLASQRQKLFNELFRLRGQLDEAEVNIMEKEQHIESLKQVMQELSHPPPPTHKEIERKYNQEVYGTEAPNVIISVQGGGGSASKAKQQRGKQEVRGKVSALRRKVTNLHDKRQQGDKGNILPFIKGFFS